MHRYLVEVMHHPPAKYDVRLANPDEVFHDDGTAAGRARRRSVALDLLMRCRCHLPACYARGPMTPTTRVPEAEVAPEFVARWSPRAFRPDPLTPEQIASLFEAMRWAPSCFNEQPWRVVYGAAGEPEHARITDILILSNQVWAARAPLLLILFARRHFTHNNKPNRTAAFDVGAAWMSLALQAGRLGLHAHAMAGFDLARAYTELGVDPETHEAIAAVAVGHRGEPDAIPQPLRAREVPSGRNPRASFVFHGRFPAPAP